jgi:CRP/FNR family cyclic AMP-dependent transcriptional regulator
MEPFRAVFQIVEDNNCPLYELSDIFILTEKSICFSEGKESCLILVRELTQLLFQLIGESESKGEADPEQKYTCSGCTGLIKFVLIPYDESSVDSDTEESLLTEKEQRLFDKIAHYPLLQAVPTDHLKKFIGCFRAVSVKKGSLLIIKDQLNKHLFILLSGQLSVEDGAVLITTLTEGEVCGEMSYFGDSIAGSSVRAAEDSKVLVISGEDFGRLIKQSDSIQFYMAKLLAKRLSKANEVRANDFDSCMQGRINEMAPAELMQVFHMHQKTGVLSLDLRGGTGRISFRDGAIVAADYDNKSGQDAFFAILGEKEGMYSFTSGLSDEDMKAAVIGDFMMLLMEGVKQEDEDEED